MKTFSIVVAVLSLLASGPVLSERMTGALSGYVLCQSNDWGTDCSIHDNMGLMLVRCASGYDSCCADVDANDVGKNSDESNNFGRQDIQSAQKTLKEAWQHNCIWGSG